MAKRRSDQPRDPAATRSTTTLRQRLRTVPLADTAGALDADPDDAHNATAHVLADRLRFVPDAALGWACAASDALPAPVWAVLADEADARPGFAPAEAGALVTGGLL